MPAAPDGHPIHLSSRRFLIRTAYETFCTATNPRIIAELTLPARPERRAMVPTRFRSGAKGDWLKRKYGSHSIYKHQVKTIQAFAAGKNVVTSTATASGKSLPMHLALIEMLTEGTGTAILIYPTKALGGDQLARVHAILEDLGLPEALAVEINGDVPISQREHLLSTARIVLCTPDILQGWLMPALASTLIDAFVTEMRIIFLDETHMYEGSFGSNTAFLMRRLRRAQKRARQRHGRSPQLAQIIAASATIASPAAHLRLLTGETFVEVTEADNGAPSHGLTVMHVEAPPKGTAARRALANVLDDLANALGEDEAFLAFDDSRQGVEQIARYVGHDGVASYRAGFEIVDRRKIEGKMRKGQLAGVVSTSALEVGIDIPQFVYGLNLGLPVSIKAFRQRLGRVGRTREGIFVIYAEASAFTRIGTTLRDYCESHAEPSHLYVENEIIQYGNARCFLEEFSDDEPVPEDWAPGFAAMVAAAKPGGRPPRAVDQVTWLDGSNAHRAFPLRKISERTYALRIAGGSLQIGTIDFDKALRECYPGATYGHNKKLYRVLDWRTSSYESVILLEPLKHAEITHPLHRTQIDISTDPAERLQNHYRRGPSGSLSEMCLRVYEAVEGYSVGSKRFSYRDLSREDRRLSRKSRQFNSTGVVLQIDEPWFRGSDESAIAARRSVAEALATILSRECSVSPGDIRSAHSGIALQGQSGPQKVEDAVVIFDNILGGLRLTAPVYERISDLLERLAKAAVIAGPDALLGEDICVRLTNWANGLAPVAEKDLTVSGEIPAGDIVVYAPESEVGIHYRGALIERRLIEPQYVSLGGHEHLMYRYECAPGVQGFVAHDEIEPIGHNWRRVLWTPATNAIREMAA